MHKNISLFFFTVFLFACTTRPNSRPDKNLKNPSIVAGPISIIREIDTNIKTNLYNRVELDSLNIAGNPFTITDNLVVYQEDSSLTFIPIDTGESYIKSWQPNSNDTFLNVRIHINADSKLLAIKKMVESPQRSTGLDSMEYAIYMQAYNLYHKPFPSAIRPVSIENNQFFDARNLEGKISVIDCWYYGCPPCMIEIEELREVMPHFGKENDVQFISFFRDSARMEDGAPVYINEKHLYRKSWFSEENKTVVEWSPVDYHARHYYNFKTFEDQLPTSGYPVTFITDKNGVVRYIFQGAGDGIGKRIERQLRLWQGFVPASK